MPKLKTHKGTAKRVKLTKTGKVLRQRAFKNHMLSKKNTSATIEGSVAKNIKRALGVK